MAVGRPGVSGKPGEHGGLLVAVDEMGGVIARADRPAEHDDAVVDELVHAGGMLVPAVRLRMPRFWSKPAMDECA